MTIPPLLLPVKRISGKFPSSAPVLDVPEYVPALAAVLFPFISNFVSSRMILSPSGAMARDFTQKKASCDPQRDQYPTLTRTGSTHDQVNREQRSTADFLSALNRCS